jgi:hypothetical protein
VRRDELEELHFITPMENLPSIMKYGILSHRQAAKIIHHSVAMNEIQKRRAKVVVPSGRPLHEYANLYICGRNPMMLVRHNQHLALCVLRINPVVLDIPNTVVTDGNASSAYVSFRAAPAGLKIVERSMTFAEDWRSSDKIQFWRNQSAKCAEVLVPDSVPPKYIVGAYVSCEEARRSFKAFNTGIPATIDAKMFFQ